jgi:hypothetical protein
MVAVEAIVLGWPRRTRIECRQGCSEVRGIMASMKVIRHTSGLEDGAVVVIVVVALGGKPRAGSAVASIVIHVAY